MEKGKISIKVLSHIKLENHIEYLINISEMPSGNNIFFPEKFQNLRSLYEQMKREAKAKQLPSFPPNKLFGYEEEHFVIQRTKDLNNFFQEIISNKNFATIPCFKNFIFSNLRKNAIMRKEKNSRINSIDNIIFDKKAQISYKNKFKKRTMLFKNSFYKMEKQNYNLDKKELKNIASKFVNLNYDIQLHSKPKVEEGYKNLFADNDLKDDKSNILKNDNDNNFELIGKNNDIIDMAEKNIDSYIKKNLENFKSMENIIPVENLLLK